MIDEEVSFLADSHSRVRTMRVWPVVCGLALVGSAAWGGRTFLKSFEADDVLSLHEDHWYAAWTSNPTRFDTQGCTWDGDDCRSSRCCAKAGSRCYVKNHHWASCNETCHTHRKWQGYVDRRGHWTVTDYPVWQCTDITAVAAPATATVTVTVPVPVPAPAPALTPYSIYEKDHDLRTKTYGDRAVPKSTPETATLAPVTWQDLSAEAQPCAP